MNKKKIEEIIELMEKYSLTEIDVEKDGVRIHLKKGTVITDQILRDTVSPVTSSRETKKTETKQEAKNLIEITSPMVGTFYRAPSPDTSSYVEIGSNIKENDVICIIEAMKLMNEIKSEVKGQIADILVENGQPIEFGQVLFLVEPT